MDESNLKQLLSDQNHLQMFPDPLLVNLFFQGFDESYQMFIKTSPNHLPVIISFNYIIFPSEVTTKSHGCLFKLFKCLTYF